MTRRQELEERALKFLADEHIEPGDLVNLLESVEREVWLKAEAEAREMQKIIERAFIRPMDQVIQQDALLDFADWCKQQAEVPDDK